MHQFRMRITLAFLLVITVLLSTIGIYVGKLLENNYITMLESRLSKEAKVISDDIIWNNLFERPDAMENRVIQFAGEVSARITVIDKTGKVLADSESKPADLPNHLDRPEVRDAIHAGIGQSKRYSTTLKHDMLYVAIPMTKNGAMIGVIRLSIPETIISATINKVWLSLTLGLFITLVIFAFIVSNVSKRVTHPIEEIIKVAKEVTQKNYKKRILTESRGEIGQLAQTINFMIDSLEKQMVTLKENEKRLEGIINNMFSGILLMDDARRIILANQAAKDLLTCGSEELIGKTYNQIDKNTGLTPLIDQCFENGDKVRDEIHLYFPEEKIIDVNLASYKSDTGGIKGIIVLLHDITSIRRLEKLRNEFVANVSHELKTPITSIKGFTETLLDGALEDPEISRHFLTIINEESDRLYRLISDILDLSRVEQKKMPLQIEEFNLSKLIKESVRIVREEAREKGIAIILPTTEDVTMEGDTDRIRQIFLNIVSNAIHYTPENGEVTIKVQQKGRNQIEIKVTDTGIGMSQEHLSRIFERFYRVDKARSRASGGTGLGLAIVKHLVEAHQGEIYAESEEGKGSTFTILFPKRQTE